MTKFFILFLLLLTILSCADSSPEPGSTYIYVSHPRINANDRMYGKVYEIDFSKYDMTLIGGDLAQNTFSKSETTAHRDSIFDFKNPNTLWSIGNHDKTSDKKFYKTTLKKKYHAYQRDDVTFITLDSQDSLSSIVGKQKEFLFAVLDTVTTASVLVMTHKLIFMNDHPVLDSQISKVCNANKGDCFHCHNPNNFYDDIYPKLVALRNKNIQVLWVGGDLGYKTSEFEYVDENGIVFLGNGLWFKKDWNRVLFFSKKDKTPLHYNFVHVDSLSQ